MLHQDTAHARPAPRVHSRAEVLRESFPEVATAIGSRRAAELESGLVADFIALGWLRREGGSLVVTPASPITSRQQAAG